MIRMTTRALLLGLVLVGCGSAEATGPKFTELQLELNQLKYGLAYADVSGFDDLDSQNVPAKVSSVDTRDFGGRRSPTKAFLMSLLVPGLGQAYNKAYYKAGAFAGIEIAAWLFNRNLDSQGDDLMAEFEQYNRDYWSRGRYAEYEANFDILLYASHHLPETNTQQYYEMTGKYDQFSWGWDDATLGGDSLHTLIGLDSLREAARRDNTVPSSPRRDLYETMRFNSNQKYKSARRAASVALVNHIIAGLEAFFDARRHNRRVSRATDGFSAGGIIPGWHVKAELKSFRASNDTPFMQLSLKF